MAKFYEVNLRYKQLNGNSSVVDKIIVKKGNFYAKEISTGYHFYMTEQENLIILKNEFYILKNEFIEENIVSLETTKEYINNFNLEDYSFRKKIEIYKNKKEQNKIKKYLKKRKLYE